jgi:hypothetical protein
MRLDSDQKKSGLREVLTGTDYKSVPAGDLGNSAMPKGIFFQTDMNADAMKYDVALNTGLLDNMPTKNGFGQKEMFLLAMTKRDIAKFNTISDVNINSISQGAQKIFNTYQTHVNIIQGPVNFNVRHYKITDYIFSRKPEVPFYNIVK